MTNAGGKYHHGDLRNALIIAAARLIEERGSEDFAMSEAAREAGVSSAAPYRHFEDKDDLLRAVCRLGFFALSQAIMETAAHYDRGSEKYIIEMGKSYVRFVADHPAFFDLMWGDRGSAALDDAEHNQSSNNGFRLLVDAVEAWCDAQQLTDCDALDISLKLWSMALGLGSLAINRHMQRFAPEADVYTLLESSTSALLRGVKTH